MSTITYSSTFPLHPPLPLQKKQITKNKELLINYLSGVLGGIVVCLIGHPFDTVKIRLQVQPSSSNVLKSTLINRVLYDPTNLVGGESYPGAGSSANSKEGVMKLVESIVRRPMEAFKSSITNTENFLTKEMILKNKNKLNPTNTNTTAAAKEGEQLYSSAIDCFKKIYKNEGFFNGFYAGIMSPLCGQMAFRAVSFAGFYGFYGNIYNPDASSSSSSSSSNNTNINSNLRLNSGSDSNSSHLKWYQSTHRPTSLIISGALTGFCIAFVETPIDLTKTKLQTLQIKSTLTPKTSATSLSSSGGNAVNSFKFNNLNTCIRFLYGKYGIRGLYQGLTSTIIRNVPANAVFFPVNELSKDYFVARLGLRDDTELPVWSRLVSGAGAGLCYWVGACPLDCIKSSIQSTPLHILQSNNMTYLKIVRNMYDEGGVLRFYRGVGVIACRSVVGCGVMFCCVDLVKEALREM